MTDQEVNASDKESDRSASVAEKEKDGQERSEQPKERELTLEEAVYMALGENQEILIASVDPRIARSRARQALGAFDPELYGAFEREDSEVPTGSQLSGATTLQTERRNRRAGVRGATVLGTEYDLFYELVRDESNSAFRTLNPQFQGSAGVTLTQPLLRGFGPDAQLAQYRAQLERLTKEQFSKLSSINQQILAVQKAYWELVRAEEEERIARNGLELARETVEVNQARFEAGRIPEVDLLQAKTQRAERREELQIRTNEVRNAQDRLLELISPPGEKNQDWQMNIKPVTEPDPTPISLKKEQKIIELATSTRMDLRAIEKEMDAVGHLIDESENQIKPNLDLELGFRRSSLDDQRNDTFEQLVDENFRTWSAGLIFSYPLWNRDRSGRLRERKLTRRQLALRRRQLETSIARDVRSGIRNVRSARNRIRIAREAERLAKDQLEAETARQEAGLSTTFQVLRLQDDLRRASGRLLNARVDYARSLAELRRATGMLVSKYN